jgi:hypothetical protein
MSQYMPKFKLKTFMASRQLQKLEMVLKFLFDLDYWTKNLKISLDMSKI